MLVKESLRSIPNKGIGYGILRYLSNVSLKDLSSSQIIFNYLGDFDNTLSKESSPLRISNEYSGASLATDKERDFN